MSYYLMKVLSGLALFVMYCLFNITQKYQCNQLISEREIGVQEGAQIFGNTVIILDLVNSWFYMIQCLYTTDKLDDYDFFYRHKQSWYYTSEIFLRVMMQISSILLVIAFYVRDGPCLEAQGLDEFLGKILPTLIIL